jgi:hypothetical protein
MYELPDYLNTKFFFYLNILPIVQEIAIYGLFLSGTICLIWGVMKILSYRPESVGVTSPWLEAEMHRKRMQYLNDKTISKPNKEMDMYFNSLLSTKDEELIEPAALQELVNLKEAVV